MHSHVDDVNHGRSLKYATISEDIFDNIHWVE